MRILYITPHLSTGGAPKYLQKMIEKIADGSSAVHNQVYIVEYSNVSDVFVVQKNNIISLIGNDKLHTLGDNKEEIVKLISEINPDIVHFIEIPELFMSQPVADKIYTGDRTYKIFESSHTSSFNVRKKVYTPDAMFCISNWQKSLYEDLNVPKHILDYPIQYNDRPDRDRRLRKLNLDPKRKHVLNVGLFTPGKNQAHIFEIAKMNKDVQFHFVGNLADNFRFYWEPLMKQKPKNCHIWYERKDTDYFYSCMDFFLFTSTYECMPLSIKEAIGWGMPVLLNKLDVYEDYFDRFENVEYINDDQKQVRKMLDKGINKYKQVEQNDMFFAMNYVYMHYDINPKEKIMVENELDVNYAAEYGPIVSINGYNEHEYTVRFIDHNNEFLHYETTIRNNEWAQCKIKYCVDWRIDVLQDGKPWKRNKFEPKDKRVYIHIESGALGDTIAWLPYAEEFRKKYDCQVILSTHKNRLIEDMYPELEIVEPGTVVENIYAMFGIAWYYNEDNKINRHRHPLDPKLIPLQQTASDILNLEFKEVKARITERGETGNRLPEDKYVCIAPHSTLQAKYWNNPGGWQKVVDYLNEQGYKVCLISNESSDDEAYNGVLGGKLENVLDYSGEKSIYDTITLLKSCSFFVGLGSGLSWLAWSMDIPTVIISGFSEAFTEMSDAYRVVANSACHGCFNRIKLQDDMDWNWCPDLKNTPRQFECTKSITFDMVRAKIYECIKNIDSSSIG